MSLSNPATKSYTQPSCTLQIVDHSSNSSAWGTAMNSPAMFDLQFLDLGQPAQSYMRIRGDRHQLAELHEVVSTYVQNLLGSSPDRFNALLSTPTSNLEATATSSQQLDAPSDPHLSSDVNSSDINHASATSTGEIFLQPSSGLSHNLFLGLLANQQTEQMIQLSMMQLFDLAAVLDEYAADVLSTPVVVRPRRAASTASSTWARIAAMLLIAAGLTTAVVQLLNRSEEQPQTANNPVTPNTRTNGQSIALKPSPATPQLSSPDNLPSPALDPTKPLTTSSPATGSISPITTPIPNTPLPPPPTTAAIPNSPLPSSIKTTQITPLSGNPQTPAIPSQPLPKQNVGSIAIPKTAGSQPNIVTNLPIAPPVNIPSPPPPKNNPPDVTAASSSELTRGANLRNTDSDVVPTTASQRLKAALSEQSDTSESPNEPKLTASASTPQLNEVKDYFQKNWQPPSGLKQTLEYSIVLDVNGTIQRIEPLGKAARTYVDRSGLPLIGEPFVSPNTNGETPRIRVVLSPNGKVQTFPETE